MLRAGCICTSALDGLNQRICIQGEKLIDDSCMQQEQLDDVVITVSDIVPVLPEQILPRDQHPPV